MLWMKKSSNKYQLKLIFLKNINSIFQFFLIIDFKTKKNIILILYLKISYKILFKQVYRINKYHFL